MTPDLRFALESRSVIDVTTFGRITGRPHRIEIWFAFREPNLFMLSGGGAASDWVRNVMENPAVVVHVGDVDLTGTARPIDNGDEDRLARTLVFEKYNPGYSGDLTTWREQSLAVAIDLVL